MKSLEDEENTRRMNPKPWNVPGWRGWPTVGSSPTELRRLGADLLAPEDSWALQPMMERPPDTGRPGSHEELRRGLGPDLEPLFLLVSRLEASTSVVGALLVESILVARRCGLRGWRGAGRGLWGMWRPSGRDVWRPFGPYLDDRKTAYTEWGPRDG